MTNPTLPAQASDEPMRAAFEVWARDPQRSGKLPLDRWPTNGAYTDSRTYIAFYGWRSALASQAMPRATADVERDAARWRYWRKKYGAECRMIPGAIWHADSPEKLDTAIDLCMPDTKP